MQQGHTKTSVTACAEGTQTTPGCQGLRNDTAGRVLRLLLAKCKATAEGYQTPLLTGGGRWESQGRRAVCYRCSPLVSVGRGWGDSLEDGCELARMGSAPCV